ncbi:MAG: cbb3-type cytochrome oxidase assembly protein CcoS [Bacteroidia bacterium]
MKIIAVLISISLVLAIVFLVAFYLALKKGQFEDLESPSFRILDKKEPKQLNQEKYAKRDL